LRENLARKGAKIAKENPQATFPGSPPVSISVVIPTLNEEAYIAETLTLLRQHRPREIIVVDGGSTDATCQRTAEADLLIHSSPGRAEQMNRGAEHASGDILLFLHADCSLETGALQEVERCLGGRKIAAGCFTMKVRESGLFYRLIDSCATARFRLTGLAYGDQGLFLRRELFARLGGFPPVRFMEDLLFSRRLRRHGRMVVIPKRILVSPRRWQRAGLMRQTLRNWTLTALAASGIDPDRLAPFYPAVR
jgi:rSAM/selenodomain-associated transferase 2